MANPYLPTNFRAHCGDGTQTNYADLDTYILLYPPLEQQALYHNIKSAKWSLGFVPEVHNLFLSSGIGAEAVNILADKIVPSKVKIGGTNPQIEEINEKFDRHLTKSIKKLVKQVIRYGSALARICRNPISNKYYIDSLPIGRFTVVCDESGRVVESTAFLDSKELDNNRHEKFVLVEKRYFKNKNGRKVACSYNGIIKMISNSLVFDKTSVRNVEYTKDNLDDGTLARFQEIYSDYELYKEVELGYDNHLGVELFNYTEDNVKFPSCWFGQAMLSDVFDLLYAYDHAFTAKENDKYLGRGRALVPMQFRNDNNLAINRESIVKGPSSMHSFRAPGDSEDGIPGEVRRASYKNKTPELDKTFYDQINGKDGQGINPTSVQFNLRTLEWREELNGTLGDIASRIGISAVDLDTRMNGSSQRTATEVNRDSDKTIATAQAKKELLTPGLNELLTTLVKSLGGEYRDIDVFIEWPKVGLANPQVQTQIVGEQYNNHLLSRETAIKRLNPEWTDKEVKEELERIKEEEESSFEPDLADEQLVEIN